LYYGFGVQQNKIESVQYFWDSANLDHGCSSFFIGKLFLEDEHFAAYIDHYYLWLQKVYLKGFPLPSMYCAFFYPNEPESISFLEKAAIYEDPEAMYHYAILLSDGKIFSKQ
jgi:TPR repeat protein